MGPTLRAKKKNQHNQKKKGKRKNAENEKKERKKSRQTFVAYNSQPRQVSQAAQPSAVLLASVLLLFFFFFFWLFFFTFFFVPRSMQKQLLFDTKDYEGKGIPATREEQEFLVYQMLQLRNLGKGIPSHFEFSPDGKRVFFVGTEINDNKSSLFFSTFG
jgi:multidrug efflux pump subunit AcrB